MAPFRTIIFGAGNIGTALAGALSSLPDFEVTLADNTDEALDTARGMGIAARFQSGYMAEDLRAMAAGQDLIVSARPDRNVLEVARLAADLGTHYLDFSRTAPETLGVLTRLAKRRAVLTGCGASPGLVETLATDLVGQFSRVDELTVRVGAIPCKAVNRLGYGRIWNMSGLLDEYLTPSAAIRDGKPVTIAPLEGYERFNLGDAPYEAFVTAGGMTDILDESDVPVRNLTFKTIRHPGHLDYMLFLLDDLGLRRRRDMLKALLCNGLPVVEDDEVIFYLSGRGEIDGQQVERSSFHRLSPAFQSGRFNALIRVAAAYAATLIGLLKEGKLGDVGFIRHRKLPVSTFLESRFMRG